MAAPNVSDLFCKAVNEGSVFQLRVLRLNHGRKAIMANWKTPCNKQGDTCLKVAIESKFYDVLEFLVLQLKGHIMFRLYKKWRNCEESVVPFSWETYTFQEVTEPFVFMPEITTIRDICHQMPITTLIGYLINVACDGSLWLEFVLSSIMASSIPRPDKIVALECMGIAFIFKHDYSSHRKPHNETIFWRGLRCWKEALILRNATEDGDPAIPKIPCDQPEFLRNALEDIAEITTVEELEQLEQQLTLPNNKSRQFLEAQALLVGHSIINRQTTRSLNSLHLGNLVSFFNFFSKRYSRAFNICLVILDQSYWFTSTSSLKCVEHFVTTVHRLFKLFYKLWTNFQGYAIPGKMASKNLVLTVKYTLAVLTNVSSVPPHFQLLDRTWQEDIQREIYVLLSDWISHLTKEQIETVKECLISFFRIYNSNHGCVGLLHWVVKGYFDAQLIQLMLEAGADPQNADGNGKTPFHCLFDDSVWYCNRPIFITIFKALLDAGGHLDQATSSGHTVISLIKEKRTSTSSFASVVRDSYFDSIIYSVLPLSCYCAQVIRQNQIPFENHLAPSLKLFVLRHSAIKITHE